MERDTAHTEYQKRHSFSYTHILDVAKISSGFFLSFKVLKEERFQRDFIELQFGAELPGRRPAPPPSHPSAWHQPPLPLGLPRPSTQRLRRANVPARLHGPHLPSRYSTPTDVSPEIQSFPAPRLANFGQTHSSTAKTPFKSVTPPNLSPEQTSQQLYLPPHLQLRCPPAPVLQPKWPPGLHPRRSLVASQPLTRSSRLHPSLPTEMLTSLRS